MFKNNLAFTTASVFTPCVANTIYSMHEHTLESKGDTSTVTQTGHIDQGVFIDSKKIFCQYCLIYQARTKLFFFFPGIPHTEIDWNIFYTIVPKPHWKVNYITNTVVLPRVIVSGLCGKVLVTGGLQEWPLWAGPSNCPMSDQGQLQKGLWLLCNRQYIEWISLYLVCFACDSNCQVISLSSSQPVALFFIMVSSLALLSRGNESNVWWSWATSRCETITVTHPGRSEVAERKYPFKKTNIARSVGDWHGEYSRSAT